MAHVDALSRNSSAGAHADDDPHVYNISLSDDDWILAAQLNDESCKNIHQLLTREPVDREGKRIHAEYVLQNNRVFKRTNEGNRWVVPKTARSQIIFYHHDNLGTSWCGKDVETRKSKILVFQNEKVR